MYFYYNIIIIWNKINGQMIYKNFVKPQKIVIFGIISQCTTCYEVLNMFFDAHKHWSITFLQYYHLY
jgi:hypothetical protein